MKNKPTQPDSSKPLPPPNQWLTVADVAARFSVSRSSVGRWIRSGLLAAIDVSSNPNPSAHRPTWRISPESLDAFINSRTIIPLPPQPKSKPHRRPLDVIEFIK